MFITGFLIVTTATTIVLFLNDRFELGGYLEEEQQELSVEHAPSPSAERELVGAGSRH